MSSGDFYEMGFTTELQDQQAIDVLLQFVPLDIREALKKQTSRLDKIHDTGRMPYLGTSNGYLWLLAVWSIPSPRHVCLMAAHPNRSKLMTIAQGLEIEQTALKRAGRTAKRQVSIMPNAVPDKKLEDRMWHNVRRGYHWSRGL